MSTSPLRHIPPVHTILDHPAMAEALSVRGRTATLQAVREVLEEARERLRNGEDIPIEPQRLAEHAAERLRKQQPTLRPVLNATGILLHTGLGRAPLAEEAVEAVARVARGYSNLEFELDSGQRGRRTTGVSRLLSDLTGAEAATVVNNNAGATLLALRALAKGREVIVSRGQLVEIGGSYRLPEVFEASGARLREVGTTNKTRLSDYEKAIGPDTAAILRVHSSNYRIVGFTEQVDLADLSRLAHAHNLLAIDDIGSGALDAQRPPRVSGEPTVQEGIEAGADLILFSGDKLLGGPQCGVLIGRRPVLQQIEADPLMRALRVDKMTLAALEATLRLALDPDLGDRRIPLWAALNTALDDLQLRAGALAERLRTELRLSADVAETTSYLGGGSAPIEPIASIAVRLSAPFPEPFRSEGALARALRLGDPAVVARVQDGAIWFDLRTLRVEDDARLFDALALLA